MNLNEAKKKFLELTKNIQNEVMYDFLQWIKNSDQFDCKEDADVFLENIASDIRACVPFQAILSSENVTMPTVGNNADCDGNVLAHVDSFLYSDDYVDELVDEGKFSRNYCISCGSRETKPLTFISHSASTSAIRFIFKHALPDLSRKTIIDVGSRLGPVLYGAYLFTPCQRIIGIEINKDLCDLQNKMIDKYKMHDRIAIVHEDVMKCGDLLLTGDVIIMNNVFEFFGDLPRCCELWHFVIRTLKGSNKLLVTMPSLRESLEPLEMAKLLEGFAEELPIDTSHDDDDADDIHLYQITAND